MKLSAILVSTAVTAGVVAGCNTYNPDLGDRPFRCGSQQPRCPDGYTCVEYSFIDQFCERDGTARLDAGPMPPDAGPFVCANDAEVEPNDTVGDAHVTGIPDNGTEAIALASLSICPDSDRDKYQFRVAVTGQTARAEIRFLAARGELLLDILAANGASIREGVREDPENPDRLVAQVPNLPDGTYFVEVRSAGEGIQNNYELDIEVTDF